MEYPAIRIQPGPANYYSYPGALEKLLAFFTGEQLSSALWIHGKRAGEAAEPYLRQAFLGPRPNSYLLTDHCTHEIVDELARDYEDVPFVVGIGGGTVQDTAKAFAAKRNIPFVAIPTIAATCAAWTPLSVWYNGSGKALGYEIFRQGAFLVLVDPCIICGAPPVYLQAGLADTIAKWYEARLLSSGVDPLPHAAVLGLEVARTIKDVLLTKGAQAFADQASGTVSAAFIEVVDAIIAGGGLVGGLGEKYTRVAAAHALHNGMSVLPATHDKLHGTKVAYGLLVQSALEHDREGLEVLYDTFIELGLPVSFRDLGVDPTDTAQIDAVIAATLVPHESIHLLPFPVDDSLLRNAILEVEDFPQTHTTHHRRIR